MKRKFKDITGIKFGRLTALKYLGKSKWLCQCDCGNTKEVNGSDLRTGNTKSCGCLNIEKRKERKIKNGLYGTRIYRIWIGMKTRCYNTKRPCYKNYGAKGIIVCDEWKNNFMNFYEWAMQNGYQEDLTIDRIDVNGNYCPENCRFITLQEQQKNRTNNHLLTYNGETMCLRDWARKLDLPQNIISRRLFDGWSIERALNTKVMVNGYV